MVLIVPVLLELAVEAHLDGLARNGDEPCGTAGQPVVGQLGLPAFVQLLLEDAVLVADRVACCVVAVSCQSVEIAGSQSAEAAVAEACVGLALKDAVDRDAELLEDGCCLVDHLKVVQAGLERTSHKELHREVEHLLVACRMGLYCKVASFCLHDPNDDLCESLVYLLIRSLLGRSLEIAVQNVKELLLELLFGDSSFCCFSGPCHIDYSLLFIQPPAAPHGGLAKRHISILLYTIQTRISTDLCE